MNIRLARNSVYAIALTAGVLLAALPLWASTFSTIDFEVAEGYAAPVTQTWHPPAGQSMQNIGQGADLSDCAYAGYMYTWNGIGEGEWIMPGGDFGVPSGNAAFFYYAGWAWSYARTPAWSPRSVPVERQLDTQFTVEFNSLVLNVDPSPNNHIPPYMNFWFNGFEQNNVGVYHSKRDGNSATCDIWLSVNGTEYNVGNYLFRQWAEEKLVFDRTLGTVSYYYNGTALGTYAFSTLDSWQTYGVGFNLGARDGILATDNIRFGTVPEPSALLALGIGLTGLIPVVRRRK